jgi:P4 family phage/plasmid primase-like protien
MPKIIDIPFGTYLAYIDKLEITEDNLDLKLEVAYGAWRGYFNAKDKILSPQIPSGAYRRRIIYATNTAEVVNNATGNNKTVVAIVIGEQKYGTENKYHNITDVVDWRTCDTLSPDAMAWAEQHYDDDVYDNTPTAYDMLPYALQYAQAGLRVFPLTPCDKMPLQGSKGLNEATNNLDKIRQWWTTNPFYNIGCATGGNIVVIDIDEGVDNNGDNKSGEDSITQWQSENGQLPDTLTAISGKGGRHLYYRTGDNCRSKTGVIKNVDIRADGGYIVLPPSIHPNGNRYTWVDDFSINKIVSANDIVNKFLSLAGSKSSIMTVSNKSSQIKIIPTTDILDRLDFNEGSRNDSLYRFGCSLQGKGVSDVDIFNELTKINLSRCNPPLSVEEVDKIYNSVISKPKGNGKCIGKSIPKVSKGVNKNSENNSDDGTFFLARHITELGTLAFGEYIEMLSEEYPYVNASENQKTGEICYTINSHKLAAYIRVNDSYFFIEGAGEKPVPYWYSNGYYKQCNDLYFLGQIKKYIEVIDENLVEPSTLNKVYKLLQTDLGNTVPANKLNSDSNIINFRNGLLLLDSMELTEHSPDIISTIQLPCDWNPSPSPCPVFDSFLSTISSNNAEMVKLLTEYIGYAVSNVPGYLTKKALFLYGPGNTGKSQYLSLLEKLVGNDNYCSITLQALEMRFGTASLFGKRVAGAADMGSATIRELEKFKSITGGDIIDFEFKGKDKFNARYNGLFVFCCNELPHFNGDRGDHVYERMILCNCTNVIPPEQRDRHLLDKLYGEREAIIYKSVMALKELLDRGGAFTEPTEVTENREAYKTENDTVRQFLVECTDLCKSDPNTPLYMRAPLTRTSEMYAYYVMWCKDNNNPYTSSQGFRKGLVNYFKVGNIKELEIYNSGIRFYKFRMKSIPILNQYYKKHI